MRLRHAVLCCVLCLIVTSAVCAETVAISAQDAQQWVRHVVPLPKQIEIVGRLQLPPDQVAVVSADESIPLVGQAMKELREALGSPGGRKVACEVRLELGGAAAADLKDLRNSDQAYRIESTVPANQNTDSGAIAASSNQATLRLVALAPRGLYYASKTLQQLIRPNDGATSAAANSAGRPGMVEVPLLRVTDWPDLADRGLWGGDSSENLRWMSDRKMNYDEQISSVRISKDKRCSVHYAPFKQRMIDEGPTYGIQPVPVILHLEQLGNSGLFEAYPELVAKGGKAGTICYSKPAFVDVLAQWLLLWRAQPGVTEVDVWLTENLAGERGCQCDQCRPQDRSVLEARAVIAAWNKARRTQPKLGLRVLTSEETEKSNPQILAELPKEVKFWYYHSLFTYNSSHRRMIRPYLEEVARQGRWVGVCMNISPLVGFWTPMSSAVFIRFRMNEFVDRGLSGLLGYAVPRLSYTAFNAEAAAEWSWNAKGRSPHEFALAYAVRRGYLSPELFAEWADIIGPVSWDIYGSEFPAGEKRRQPGKLADLLKKGKLPELGEVLWGVYGIPFGDFRKPEQIDRDVAAAEKAVALAGKLGLPEYLQESRVIQGYMLAVEALWELKQVVTADGIAPKDREAAHRYFQSYVDGLNQAREALPAWEAAVSVRNGGEHLVREKPLELLGEMIQDMKEVAAGFGIDLKVSHDTGRN